MGLTHHRSDFVRNGLVRYCCLSRIKNEIKVLDIESCRITIIHDNTVSKSVLAISTRFAVFHFVPSVSCCLGTLAAMVCWLLSR